MSLAAVALGSNLGDRMANIRGGVASIAVLPGISLLKVSGIMETAALVRPGHPPGPDYLNAVVLVETTLSPSALLAELMTIERAFGRDRSTERAGAWAARTLDLDLLLVGDAVVDTPELVLPHPRMHERRFVLEPLARVAPDLRHPRLGQTAVELLAALPSGAGRSRLEPPAGRKPLTDPAECALWLACAMAHIDAHVREGVRSAIIGDPGRDGCWALMAIDPTRVTPFPSNNPNCAIIVCRGDPTRWELGSLADAIIAAFDEAEISRYFIWLTPAACVPSETPALAARGLVRFIGPEYLTLLRASAPVAEPPTRLSVRLLSAADAECLGPELGEATGHPRIAGFMSRAAALEDGGFHQFAAFEGDRAVAYAASLIRDGAAYLGWATTHPEFRGRGGQSALIAARLRHAQERGCGWSVSETVSIGTTSLGNLRRAGFEVSHTAAVYQRE